MTARRTNTPAARAGDAGAELLRLAEERGGKTMGVNLAMPTVTPSKRRGKYRNQPTIYAGCRYDSKAEAQYAAALDSLKAAGLIRGWFRQARFMLGCPENVYVCDFVRISTEGVAAAVDVKGIETPKFKRDRKLWRAYGFMPLLIVKGGKVSETILPACMETEHESDGN